MKHPFGNVRKTSYYDSILIYMYMRIGFYKIYALHRHVGRKLSGELVWKYYIMPVPDQPHYGYETIPQVHEHIRKLFKNQKSLFDEWAALYPKDGRIVSIQRLANALVYTWVDNG